MPPAGTPVTTKQQNVTIVSLGPEFENIDEPSVDQVKDLLLEVAESADPPHVVLDMRHTQFFGSAFIEVLFRVWDRVNTRNGRFAVSSLTPYCAEVIDVTHLDRLWDFFPSCDEAVAALAMK
jgi:anti-sigma B factor antagonist